MFAATTDYLVFRSTLRSALERYECALHAYVLMTNHVHLLLSCTESNGIGRLMQSVGRGYVRYFNDRYQRTGTLWEGRYRATVIESDQYLFSCYRYIEENPLRAGMVQEVVDYRWSSHGYNALGCEDALITPHEQYLELGSCDASRQSAYRAFFRRPNDSTVLSAIRDATNGAWALGSDEFRLRVSQYGRRAAPLPSGPRNSGSDSKPGRSLTPN
jgi:putative transposase